MRYSTIEMTTIFVDLVKQWDTMLWKWLLLLLKQILEWQHGWEHLQCDVQLFFSSTSTVRMTKQFVSHVPLFKHAVLWSLFFSGKRLFVPFPIVLFIPCTPRVHPQPDWSIHHETRWGDFAATVCWLFLIFFSSLLQLYFYITFCVFFSCLLSFYMRFHHLA